jgi:hypothetical protein
LDCQLLQNDRTTQAAVLHQILPKAWQYPSGNYSKDATGFPGRCHEYHRIKEWYSRFEDGSTSVDSEPRHGKPLTSRNDNVIYQVRTLLMQDRRITVRELADKEGVSIGSVRAILNADLVLRRVSMKFMPKLLMMEQKQLRLEIAQNMLDCVESDSNFLNTVITGDESLVYEYDPETKAQSSQWNIHHPRGQRKHGRSAETSR